MMLSTTVAGPRWLALLLAGLLLGLRPAQAQNVTLSSFSPTSGPVGSSVVLTGTNMTGVVSVRFGEVSAAFTINSSTQITAVVPRVASTQRLAVALSQATRTFSTADFVVTRASSSPAFGLVAPGFAGVSGGANAAPAVADLDNDGRLDLLVGRADGTVARYEQTAVNATTFTALGSVSADGSPLHVGSQASVSIADPNSDGRFSLLVGRADGLVYEYVQTGIGAATFTLNNSSLGNIATGANAAPTVTNLNGNLLLDVLVGKADGTVGFFEQNSPTWPDFTRITASLSGIDVGENSAPLGVDLDGNNRIDLLVGSAAGTIAHYEQDRVYSTNMVLATSNFNNITAGANARPCVTDVDGDGLLDLLVGRADGTIDRFEQGTFAVSSVAVPASGTYGAGASLDFTVTFNQPVTVTGTPTLPLTVGSTARTATYVSGSGSAALVFRYTVASGELDTDGPALGNSLSLNGGTIRNGSANTLLALNNVPATTGVLVDAVPPTATLSSPAPTPTRTAPIPFTVTFSEPVTGFALSDLAVTNGTATNGSLSGSGASYSFSVTPTPSGNPPATVAVALRANTVADAGNNSNPAASNTLSRVYDTQAPTATVSGPAGSTSTSPISLTVTFSEAVTGFGLNDLSIGNGAASGLSGSGTTYSFSVTPAGPGPVTVQAVTGAAQDAATNPSIASNTFSLTYAPPVAVVSSVPDATPTNAAAATFTVTFSGSVAGGSADNFGLTASGTSGAAVTGISGNGSTRVVTVNTGSGDGTLRLDVANANGLAPTLSNAPYTGGALLTVDKTSPGVVLSSVAPNPARTAPIPVTVAFSENVTGFSLANVSVGNGTASGLTGGGASYSFSVTPTADGPVTVQVNAGAASDAATNPSLASNTLSRTYDTAAPTATLSTPAGSATNAGSIPVTVTFSESVTGFALSDLSVTNGTAGSLSGGGASYSFLLTPTGSGNPPAPVTVALPANTVADAAGNANAASSSTLSISYDTQVPTVSLSSPAPNPTNVAPIPVTVTFSESVTGFTLADVSVGNGTAGSLTGSGASYAFSVTPAGVGLVTVTVNASAAQDAAGNLNPASSSLTRTYSNVGPTLTLTSPAGSSFNTAAITVAATFSTGVTGFALSDIATTNGTASNLTGSGASYSFTLTPAGQGAVTASVAANQAQDAATNGNTASNVLSRTYDTAAPTLTLATTAPASANAAAFTVTATFSEPVTGFDLTDVSVSNGTASGLTGSGASYSFTLTASGSGSPASLVTVSVAAARAQDAATNGNAASNSLSRTYDTQAPTATLASTAPSPTATAPIPVTLTFSESVTGFTLADVSVGNGTASGLTGSGASYAFSVAPTAAGLVTVDVAAGAAQDAATNASLAATRLSRTYQPAARIIGVGPSQALTNAASVTFGVPTTAPITGWNTGNFSLAASGVSGAAITGVTTSGNTATVTVSTGSGDGAIRLDVPNATGLTPTLSNVPYIGGTVTIDRTAPAVSGVANNMPYNSNRTITFSDAHAPTATLNGAAFASGSTVSVEGSYTLTVTDGAGNQTVVSFVLDKTPPSTVILNKPALYTNDPTPSFTFDSPDGGVQYTTTGGPGLSFANNGPNSTFGPLADGTYTLTVAAVDAAGNPDPTPESYTFTVDTQAPNTSITAQPANPTPAPTAHFEFAATEASSTFAASLDGAPYAAVNPLNTNYSGLAQGSHTLLVRATDRAGNPDATPASYTWTVLPPAPTLTAISPAVELPGQLITLTGTNFTSGSTVTIGGVAALVAYGSATSLTATVPATVPVGSAAVVVTTASGSSASTPAFAVVQVFDGVADCTSTASYLAVGDGQWHYLRLPSGEVILALRDDNARLGTITASFRATGGAQPVRQDARGRAYLDRNFQLAASGGRFDGSTVALRFYGLASELTRLQAADANATPASLKATQYSGPNEDCDLTNNDAAGEYRVLAAPATVPGGGLPWFVSTVTVADHFSEFFLTGSATPLPVQLVAFTATAQGSRVQLAWRTASEVNSARFEVERSLDGLAFTSVGQLAAAGNSTTARSYALTDANLPAGASQLSYRLRQIDLDGTAHYSPVRVINREVSLALFPNPTTGAATLTGATPGAPVQVLDALGRLVATATTDASGTAALKGGWPSGIYVVRVGGGTVRLAVE